jgi:hypothetical protein
LNKLSIVGVLQVIFRIYEKHFQWNLFCTEDGMSLIPLVWSNGVSKLEISEAGISVVAHISEKKSLHNG